MFRTPAGFPEGAVTDTSVVVVTVFLTRTAISPEMNSISSIS